MTLLEVRDILDWMTREEGAQRAEWIGKEGEKESAWIYWRRPEEWAEALSNWVRPTTKCGRPLRSIAGAEIQYRLKKQHKEIRSLLFTSLLKEKQLEAKVSDSRIFEK